MVEFTHSKIIEIFGNEDAENEKPERLKEYFYRNKSYNNIVSDIPIGIVVGHKGVGKSALLKMSSIEKKNLHFLTLWIKPGDLDSLDGTYDSNFNKQINAWKLGILNLIFNKIIEFFTSDREEVQGSVLISGVQDFIRTVKSYLQDKIKLNVDDTRNSYIEKVSDAENIFIYIDDLDRGWIGTKDDTRRISALLNAVRDICGEHRGLHFRIALRTDVYYLVRTSDESTDKIEQYIIDTSWSQQEILLCMVKRIGTYFDKNYSDPIGSNLTQAKIAQPLTHVVEDRFSGEGKWKDTPIYRVILSLTRRRPRDFVKLLSAAAKEAHRNSHSIIKTNDLKNIFQNYSQERLQDIINEFKSELSNIEDLLMSMRQTKKEKQNKTGFKFKNDELNNKMSNILSNHTFIFSNGKRANIHDLKKFLYKIDFIIARNEQDNGDVSWEYFDQNRFAAASSTDFGYKWEIHPAYRWALEPRDVNDVINGIGAI